MYQILVVGGGSWGTTIAKILAENCGGALLKNPIFSPTVTLLCHEASLARHINKKHENNLYLPGIRLPPNVFATTEISPKTTKNIAILAVPHQYLPQILTSFPSPVHHALTVSKGFHWSPQTHQLSLLTQLIKSSPLKPKSVACLVGANIARQVAQKQFSETTIACSDPQTLKIYKTLFSRPYFQIQTTFDTISPQVFAALKNVTALAVGLAKGLGYGGNTQVALLRKGLLEMRDFAEIFKGNKQLDEKCLLESCGIADLIVSCQEGRNFRVAARAGATGKGFEALEKEMLAGQKLQGTETAVEVGQFLEHMDMEDDFPLFWRVYEIVSGKSNYRSILDVF